MASRLKLHEVLIDILESKNVYYEPPSSLLMKYPAIVYSLDDIDKRYADNNTYNQKLSYALTLITDDPDDSKIIELSALKSCRFDRSYVADNLHHYVYTLKF